MTYEKQRGENWQNFIEQTKNAIAACKKELAFHQQIPPVVFMFDACNNHSYTNTSEFKVEAISDKPKRVLSASELPKLGELPENIGESAERLPKLGNIETDSADRATLPYLADSKVE